MILMLTTVGTRTEAERLARGVVENRLAACVNVLRIESSVYQWKGKLKKEKEFLLLIKTATPYKKVERFVRANHPYTLPEIIALPIVKGYKKYLNWLTQL